MKKIISLPFLFIFFGLLFSKVVIAQVNLVPNPSFEDTVHCPQGLTQIFNTQYWQAGYGSVDYFNECAISQVGVPLNILGYQFANTGVAYAGEIIFHTMVNNGREFIEIELMDSLIAYSSYNVEFYVSLADSEQYGIWNLGAYFSVNGIQGNALSQILTYLPQVNNSQGNYITNKNGWTKIKGSFIAGGGEKFITIGNFEDDSVIDTLFVGGSSNSGAYDWRGSYYYLDDVAVYKDSTVGLNEAERKEQETKVFPNPAKNEITIMFEKESVTNTTIEVFDLFGNIMLNENIIPKNKQVTISVNQLGQGVYLYKIQNSKGIIASDRLVIIR
jgi:hypothetical protein